MKRILVVDDERPVRQLVQRILAPEGFDVEEAASGRQAFAALEKHLPDLVVLDFNLPDLSADQIYGRLRDDGRTRSLPVLIITGRDVEGLPARCLNGGADAYLAKPFEMTHFVAQVRALLRRAAPAPSVPRIIESGDLRINIGEHRILLNGRMVDHLTPKEFALLSEIASRSPNVVDKKTLATSVWNLPVERLHERTLDVHVQRIRRKLGPAGASRLKTVTGLGYQWYP
jgi:DNA-binding response OmpR family regulator